MFQSLSQSYSYMLTEYLKSQYCYTILSNEAALVVKDGFMHLFRKGLECELYINAFDAVKMCVSDSIIAVLTHEAVYYIKDDETLSYSCTVQHIGIVGQNIVLVYENKIFVLDCQLNYIFTYYVTPYAQVKSFLNRTFIQYSTDKKWVELSIDVDNVNYVEADYEVLYQNHLADDTWISRNSAVKTQLERLDTMKLKSTGYQLVTGMVMESEFYLAAKDGSNLIQVCSRADGTVLCAIDVTKIEKSSEVECKSDALLKYNNNLYNFCDGLRIVYYIKQNYKHLFFKSKVYLIEDRQTVINTSTKDIVYKFQASAEPYNYCGMLFFLTDHQFVKINDFESEPVQLFSYQFRVKILHVSRGFVLIKDLSWYEYDEQCEYYCVDLVELTAKTVQVGNLTVSEMFQTFFDYLTDEYKLHRYYMEKEFYKEEDVAQFRAAVRYTVLTSADYLVKTIRSRFALLNTTFRIQLSRAKRCHTIAVRSFDTFEKGGY